MPYESVPCWIREVPEHLKTQEMCNEVVAQSSYALRYVPDELKTQQMCNEAIRENPAVFFLVPEHLRTQEMWIKALEVDPWQLYYISDCYKTQEMSDDVVRRVSCSLIGVLDCFVTSQQIKIWHNSDDWHDDNEVIEWYEGYKKRKTQKAKIKEELLPTAWHPDRVMNWCMSEDVCKNHRPRRKA